MKKLLLPVIACISLLEQADANDQAPFRVVYFDNYAPYSWLDDGGRMQGIFIDVLDQVIGRQMQRPVEHYGFPWARAQKYVRTGEYDAMIAPRTREREGYTNLSQQPVLVGRMAIFTRTGHPKMQQLKETRSLDDIRSFDFVTQLGDGWAGENLQSMNVQYASDLNTVLQMLNLGRADLFIEASLVTHWNLRNLNLGEKIAEVDGVTIEETPYYLMVSKNSEQQFLQEFDRQMQIFAQSGELERLLQRYK